jgi:hypothetical protein
MAIPHLFLNYCFYLVKMPGAAFFLAAFLLMRSVSHLLISPAWQVPPSADMTCRLASRISEVMSLPADAPSRQRRGPWLCPKSILSRFRASNSVHTAVCSLLHTARPAG